VTPSTSAPLVGAVLADRYALEQHLARGGMSDVYQATDQVLHRQVAVKVYRAGAAHDRARFDAEVHLLAGLSHPGLVQVYDAGEQEGDGYVVLELVDGPTLRAVLEDRGQVPADECSRLGSDVADALAYIHAGGVVHRDVNPSNILCGPDGRPRLADFGIARLIDTTRITAPVDAIGTAPYMAPEQVRGEDVTPAADVYALGLVLAEMLTGTPVFGGPPHEAAMARLAADPDLTGIVGPWRDLLTAMTAREPDARPSAEQVRDGLAELAGTAAPAVAIAASAPSGVPDGSTTADPFAQTTAIPAAPAAGGTSVMPAVLAPDAPSPTSAAGDPAPSTRRRPLWLALAAVALVLVIAAAAAAGGGSGTDPSTSTTTPTTEAFVVTTTAPATTTTSPPAAEQDGEGKDDEGKGGGNGKGKKGDD
jgi:eukaryotic-like serine/threonine-protein kinase